MLDFFEILEYQFGLYNPDHESKSKNTYKLYSTTFEFVGMDEKQKFHGKKQDILWINEAMECTYQSFRQLIMRTTMRVILDYNPSTDTHWIYDKVIPRDDCTFIHSTYRDNPFLEPEIVAEIERMEPTPENIEQGTADETNWKIYGLGLRAAQRGLIFGDFGQVDRMPEEHLWRRHIYGLDFGYTNHPTALVRIVLSQGKLHWQQLIYERGLTNTINPNNPDRPSIELRLKELDFPKNLTIWADSAEPKSIQALCDSGYDVRGADKGPGSVNMGIDLIKQYPNVIDVKSIDIIKERNNYKWKVDPKTDEPTNEPVDAFNHAFDGGRYAVSMELDYEPVEPGVSFL
jgi:phage terminase large subunit